MKRKKHPRGKKNSFLFKSENCSVFWKKNATFLNWKINDFGYLCQLTTVHRLGTLMPSFLATEYFLVEFCWSSSPSKIFNSCLFSMTDRKTNNNNKQTSKTSKSKQNIKTKRRTKKRDYICSQKLKHKIQRLANDWEFPLMRVKYFIFIVLSTNGSCDPRIWKTALCKCKNVHFHVAAMNEWNIVVKSPPQQMEWLWFP